MKTLSIVSLGLALVAFAPLAAANNYPAPVECDFLQPQCDAAYTEVRQELEPHEPLFIEAYETAFCTAASVDPTEGVRCPDEG